MANDFRLLFVDVPMQNCAFHIIDKRQILVELSFLLFEQLQRFYAFYVLILLLHHCSGFGIEFFLEIADAQKRNDRADKM